MTTNINGIDVSECAFYSNGKCDNSSGMACNCVNNTVCCFKELKRLQEQNDKLKEEIEKLNEEAEYFINGDYCDEKCNSAKNEIKYKQALEEIRE